MILWSPEGWNSGVRRAVLPLKPLGKILSRLFLGSGVCWQSLLFFGCSFITLISSSLLHSPVCLSVCLCLLVQIPLCFLVLRHHPLNLGPTLISYNLILIWLHLQRPFFQLRSQSQGPGLELKHVFWGEHIKPTIDIFLWPSTYTPSFSSLFSASGSWPKWNTSVDPHGLWFPVGFSRWEVSRGD